MSAACRNALQKGVNALAKIILKLLGFCQKHQNFVQIYVWREFRLPESAFATVLVLRKNFNGKFTAKIYFRAICVTITDADIGSFKSLRTLL